MCGDWILLLILLLVKKMIFSWWFRVFLLTLHRNNIKCIMLLAGIHCLCVRLYRILRNLNIKK